MATGFATTATSQAADTELAVFIPELWGDAVRASFKKSLVLGNLAKDYSSLVSGGGDKIWIPTYQDVGDAVSKTQGEPVDFTRNLEVAQSITVDQHYATAIMIDDLAKVQSSYDLISGLSESMGYKLALNIEKALFTKLSDGLNAVEFDNFDDSVDRVLNKERLSGLITYMYSQNLRPEECTLVLSNRLYASLFKLDDFIHASKVGNMNLPAGSDGQLMGMNVIHSPEVGNDAVHADTTSETGAALADTRRPGGYVVHNSALGIAYSKAPTPVTDYDIAYIGWKMVTDVIYGCNLLQDTNQVRAISLTENGHDTAAAWQS